MGPSRPPGAPRTCWRATEAAAWPGVWREFRRPPRHRGAGREVCRPRGPPGGGGDAPTPPWGTEYCKPRAKQAVMEVALISRVTKP
eukprot:scaffold202438_cov19-Prasinocladus_malaysianus.AAC.1